jgi:hypothetical protein
MSSFFAIDQEAASAIMMPLEIIIGLTPAFVNYSSVQVRKLHSIDLPTHQWL